MKYEYEFHGGGLENREKLLLVFLHDIEKEKENIMAYRAKIRVTLRPSILDVQGKAVQHALENLGYSSVSTARIGKYIEVAINEDNPAEAERISEEMCRKLLANPVMEDYSIELEEIN